MAPWGSVSIVLHVVGSDLQETELIANYAVFMSDELVNWTVGDLFVLIPSCSCNLPITLHQMCELVAFEINMFTSNNQFN